METANRSGHHIGSGVLSHPIGLIPSQIRKVAMHDVGVIDSSIKEISDPLGHHQSYHNRKTIGNIIGGLNEDDSQ